MKGDRLRRLVRPNLLNRISHLLKSGVFPEPKWMAAMKASPPPAMTKTKAKEIASSISYDSSSRKSFLETRLIDSFLERHPEFKGVPIDLNKTQEQEAYFPLEFAIRQAALMEKGNMSNNNRPYSESEAQKIVEEEMKLKMTPSIQGTLVHHANATEEDKSKLPRWLEAVSDCGANGLKNEYNIWVSYVNKNKIKVSSYEMQCKEALAAAQIEEEVLLRTALIDARKKEGIPIGYANDSLFKRKVRRSQDERSHQSSRVYKRRDSREGESPSRFNSRSGGAVSATQSTRNDIEVSDPLS